MLKKRYFAWARHKNRLQLHFGITGIEDTDQGQCIVMCNGKKSSVHSDTPGISDVDMKVLYNLWPVMSTLAIWLIKKAKIEEELDMNHADDPCVQMVFQRGGS